ncbi:MULTISPECIES: Spy/CpxP family protein refolding chaperone [Nostocales]|uniref:P pilus assembly/Cpx signaling pathway, periplasmic inhibitor/zinc-resistance associated protein n=3 Tax=Nostocales TaxID=1161 RepID=A0A0C1R5I1_9CYAN|nr:Spy/CpxP family protein refolding chaperone [Tolypothrix bouteillei]KAF3888260.1 hypothetical protein DA73_0400024280 [Tolypothrix bouteillei VB521301]
MKFKYISVLILATTATIISTSAIRAQFPPGQGQNPGRQGILLSEQGPPDLQELNLSEEQKDKLKEVREQTRAKFDEILTTEQRNTLKQAFEAGQKPPEAMESIGLSEEQKQQIREAIDSEKQKISEILTSEQKQLIRDRIEQMHKDRPENPGGFPT